MKLEKAIEKITEIVNIRADELMEECDLSDLIKANRIFYEMSYKENRMDKVIWAKISHLMYVEEAKRRRLDISRFPEELNYLEVQN